MLLGLRRSATSLAGCGLALWFVAALPVAGSWAAGGIPAALPVLNVRGLVAIGLTLVPLAALLVARRRNRSGDLPTTLGIAAGAMGLVVASCELPLHILRVWGEPAQARLALTLGWLGYATLLLVGGFAARMRPARLAALALFALTAAKLLLVDLADQDTLVRIVGFCVTGLVLIAASWLYHRLERALDDDGDQPEATGET